MLSSRNGGRPDAPTRLNENAEEVIDYFETRVYEKTENLFYMLDNAADPDGRDWVLVTLRDGTPAWEIYDGQNFVALIRMLKFYKLRQGSEQQRKAQRRHRLS